MKDPYKRTTSGVGYLGEAAGKNLRRTRAYDVWAGLFLRCYAEKGQKKFPAYRGCTVAEEWHDFSKFHAWYTSQPHNDDREFHLDKDILHKGNKVYGPEFCRLIPGPLNRLLESRRALRGDCPIGVSLTKSGRYGARCRDGDGNYPHLGSFDDAETAFNVYKTFKEAVIKKMAERYKDAIPSEVFAALQNYKVEITD